MKGLILMKKIYEWLKYFFIDKYKTYSVNQKFESSIFTKRLSNFLIVLGIFTFSLSELLALIIFLCALYGYYLSRKLKRSAYGNGFFRFPQEDAEGHPMLKVYDVPVSGVTHETDGWDPQDIIPHLKRGDRIILEADPDNQYDDYAVKVKTINDIQIGWIKRGLNLQIDIFNRLMKGREVYARVNEVHEFNSSKGLYGLTIEVARYTMR